MPFGSLAKDWIELWGVHKADAGNTSLPWYGRTDNEPEFSRNGSRFFVSTKDCEIRLAGVLVDSFQSLETVAKELRLATSTFAIWCDPAMFCFVAELDGLCRVDTLVILPATQSAWDAYYLFNRPGIGFGLTLDAFENLVALDTNLIEWADLTPIAKASKLAALRFQASRNVTCDLSVLSSLNDLRSLSLDVERFTSLDALASLAKLQALELPFDFPAAEANAVFQACTRLESLDVNLGNFEAAPSFHRLKQLRRLHLINSAIGQLPDLEIPNDLRHLKVTAGAIGVSDLYAFPHLESLWLDVYCKMGTAGNYPQFPYLRRFSLSASITNDQFQNVIRSSPKLEYVSVRGCDHVSRWEALSELPLLKVFKFDASSTMRSLAWLKQVDSLEVLCGEFESAPAGLKAFHSLHKLRLLDLWHHPHDNEDTLPIFDCGVFENSRSLQVLRLAGWTAANEHTLQDHHDLIDLYLDFSDCNEYTTIALHSPRLYKISGYYCPFPRAIFGRTVTRLEASFAGTVDLAEWRQVDSIEYIDLENCKFVQGLDSLRRFSRLTALRLSAYSPELDYRILGELPYLESLSFDEMPWEPDLSWVADLDNVRFLDLPSALSVTSVAPFAKCKKLVGLSIVDYQSLEDISPLAELQELRYLDLTGCECIADFSPLTKLKKLRRLSLSYTPISDLSILFELPHLYWLDVQSCEGIDPSTLDKLQKRGVWVFS